MQDFSRLRIGQRIRGRGLIGRQAAQHAARHVRRPPQHLQCRDQPVAAERGRVPGNAGIGVTALRRVGHQHREIGGRSAQHRVETLVRRLHGGLFARRLAHFPARRNQTAQEWQRRRARPIAAHSNEKRTHFARLKVKLVSCRAGRKLVRRRIEIQRSAPYLAVQTIIGQNDPIVAVKCCTRGTPPITARAAHLEQIGKVVFEVDRQAQIDRLVAVVAHAEPLIGGVAPEKDRAQDMDAILFHDDVLTIHQIGIGQIDEESRVVVTHIGAEQKRRPVVDPQFQTRQVPRVAMEQSARRAADITATVEDDERVAIFKRAWRPARLGRSDGERRFSRRLAVKRRRAGHGDFDNIIRLHRGLGGGRLRFSGCRHRKFQLMV